MARLRCARVHPRAVRRKGPHALHQLFDLRTGECHRTVDTGHAVHDVQFDDERLVCATADTDVLIYGLRTGQDKRLPRHQRGIRSAKFYGDMLVTGSMDSTAKIWKI